MRRRMQIETDGPPREVVSYLFWCAACGLQPYGEYDQPETMDASYEQHDQWTAHRADYERATGSRGQSWT